MHCTIRSADRTMYDGDVDQIVARSPHGEFAVRNGHAPMISILVAGIVRVRDSAAEHKFVCRRGTFELNGNRATVLVERPYRPEEIDPAAIRRTLDDLRGRGASEPMDLEEIAYLELLCRVKESHG